MDWRVEKVMQTLKKNDLSAHPDLRELAEAVRISPAHLRAIFRKETGLTPAQYLKRIRFERARELAETTNLKVCEIMERLNISEETHFLRDFKKHYGKTMLEFRNDNLRRRQEGNEDRQEQNNPQIG